MSEILSENELQMIEDLHRYSDTGQSRTIRHLIASHRQLQAERDALKAELEFHKQAALNFIDLSAELQKQRDALKAELAEEKWKHGDFEIAPCFICGYNGQGYYQPDTHPCASEYHRRREAKL